MDPRRDPVELDQEDRRVIDRLVVMLRSAKAVSLLCELRRRLDDRELEQWAYALRMKRGESGRWWEGPSQC